MADLITQKCIPCTDGILPLNAEVIATYMQQLHGWQLVDDKKIVRIFIFTYFTEAMAFVNKVAAIAEAEGHHPNIAINYNKVTLTLYTHAINGLHENDFILAAKINAL